MDEVAAGGGRLILPGHPMIRISSQAVEAVCLIGASAEAVWELLKEQVQPEMRVEAFYCGQIINTAIQVTSDPPRVAVIINKENLTHEMITKSRVFGVSVLGESAPMAFIGLFGFRSGRDIDKLSKAQFKEGTTGCPLVTEHALSVLEARVTEQIDLGTHTVAHPQLDTTDSEVMRCWLKLMVPGMTFSQDCVWTGRRRLVRPKKKGSGLW